MIRLLKKAALTAMVVGMGAAWGGSPYDLGAGGTTNPVVLDEDTVIYLGSPTQQVNATPITNTDGHNLTIGTGTGVTNAYSGDITIGGTGVAFNTGSGDTRSLLINNSGMNVTISTLTFANADPGDGTGAFAQNALTIEGTNTLNITNNAEWGQLKSGATNGVEVTVNLGNANGENAYLNFNGGNGLHLINGSINGNGEIDGNVTLGTAAGTGTDGRLLAGAGVSQLYKDNVSVKAGGVYVRDLAVGATGDSRLEVTGNLTFDNNNVNEMYVTAASGNADLEVGGTLTLNNVGAASVSNVNNVDYLASVKTGNLVVNNTNLQVGENGNLLVDGTGTASITRGQLTLTSNGQAIFENAVDLGDGTTNAATISVDGAESVVAFNDSLNIRNDNSGFTLSNGGIADFSGIANYSLNNGFINIGANGGIIVADANGLTVENAGDINVAANATGYVMENSAQNTAAGATGNLIIKTNNAISLAANSSRLEARDLTVTNDVGTSAAAQDIFRAGSAGTLAVQNYTINEGAFVKKAAGVAIEAEGRGDFFGSQEFAGTNSSFEGGVNVHGPAGVVSTDGTNASITVGSAAKNSNIVVDNGGKLMGKNNSALSLVNGNASEASLSFTGASANILQGTINATGGAGFRMNVKSDVNMSNATVSANVYKQDSGIVSEVDGSRSSTIIAASTDQASQISGNASEFGVSGTFRGGLSVTNGAKILGTGWNSLDSGTRDTGRLVFSGAVLDLSEGSLGLRNFKEIILDGNSQLIIGYDGGVNALNLTDTTLTARSLANSVKFTDDYLTHYYGNGSITADNSASADQIINGTVNGSGSWTVSNVFGDFGYQFDTNNGAWLNSYEQTDLQNMDEVASQLGKNWGAKVVSNGLAGATAGAAKNILGLSDGMRVVGEAGNDNLSMLKALASNNRSFDLSNGSTGVFDKGLLAAFNGQMAAGPVYVAQDTLRDIATTLHSRLDAYRAVYETIGSDNAYGSAGLMNDRYLNRIWVGGLGTWQNADMRKGFDGYKYDGAGVMLGYDRAAGAAIFGVSLAYVEGDYEDKTTKSHDSKIKQYAADVYATYNGTSGFFGTIMGGYSYADNDINEIRGGLSAREDYHTNTWHAGARVGYDIEPCDNFTISPSIGADFYYSRTNGHDVKYGGQDMWKYGKMKNHNVEIPVEVKIAYEVPMGQNKALTLMANGGYAYNLNDKGVYGDVTLNGTDAVAIRAIGRKLGHHSWKAGAGAKFRYNQWDIGVKYDYYGRSEYNAHRVMGQVGYNF